MVKVETNVPGLHGVGCATLTQRPTPVCAAVDDCEADPPLAYDTMVSRQLTYLSSCRCKLVAELVVCLSGVSIWVHRASSRRSRAVSEGAARLGD